MTTERLLTVSDWHEDEGAQRVLQGRADRAAAMFLEPDLAERLVKYLAASKLGGSKMFRIRNTLRSLSEELAALAVAERLGAKADRAAYDAARDVFVGTLMRMERLSLHRRDSRPPWNSDLWSSDIGMNLSIALYCGCRALDRVSVERLVREQCLEPVLRDWVDDATRLHALDTMGHNWWSVIVGDAGVMAAVLGDTSAAERIADNLRAWAAYPGNVLSRKQANFGPAGDFVEGFGYGQYALLSSTAFGHFYPGFNLVPDMMSTAQARGMADWLKSAFVPVASGWHPQCFGDIKLYDYYPHAEFWHTLAALADDPHLLDLAHQIRPQPQGPMEMLMWRTRPKSLAPAKVDPPLRRYSVSGLAMLRRGGQRVTVRAGEFWNHNHLDAGTFIYHEDEVVWLDDCGVCAYSLQAYNGFYVRPMAHNVAFAPALETPTRRTFLESPPLMGRYVCEGADGDVSVLCADTNVLSGGSLMRSYRWFIDLGGEAFVVWDDLSGHTEQAYESHLHTVCDVAQEEAGRVVLREGDKTRTLHPFSDMPTAFKVEPVMMGEAERDGAHRMGHAMIWRSEPALRGKFGLATGGAVREARWSTLEQDGGWQCDLVTAQAAWSVWFNPLADSRITHENCIVDRWGLTSDAYALVRREDGRGVRVWAVHGSFVRQGETVLAAGLKREPLRAMKLV